MNISHMSRRFSERHVLHHIARLHNLLKSLHNSSPIGLASPMQTPPALSPQKIDVGAKSFEIQMVHS